MIGRSKHALMALLLYSLLPLNLSADFHETGWPHFKPIQGLSSGESGLVRFSLDGEVFDRSKAGLADLRMVNDQQQEVPYVLIEEKETTHRQEYEARVFNRGVVRGSHSTLTLDLGQSLYNNRLTLHTTSENFKRKVEISGSQDGHDWVIVRDDGYIVDFSGDQKIQLTTLQYPENNFRYLLVKILDGGEHPLEIDRATISFVKIQTPPRQLRLCDALSREEDPKTKATVSIFDLRYRHLPWDQVNITTPEDNFCRLIQIHGSNDLQSWQRQLQSEIYRFRTNRYEVERRSLQFPEARHRYLKLVIFNYDDQPLRLEKVEVQGIDKDILFEARPGRSYFLYYGNDQASTPRYDLEQVKNYVNLEKVPRVQLAAARDNPRFHPSGPRKPWTERWPALFWGSLLVLAISLGAVIIRMMKRVKPV
ncbi:MAG: DUF3999 family protein [Acidobacteriota bacterium]